jgi:hypothetical protein
MNLGRLRQRTNRPPSSSISSSCLHHGDARPVPDEVAALVEVNIAESTRRAYRFDLGHFAAWGGLVPAEPGLVASYLAAHAETLSVATLVRRIAAISKEHEARGCQTPVGLKSSAPHCGASSASPGRPA